jgi:hypothetical protein
MGLSDLPLANAEKHAAYFEGSAGLATTSDADGECTSC